MEKVLGTIHNGGKTSAQHVWINSDGTTLCGHALKPGERFSMTYGYVYAPAIGCKKCREAYHGKTSYV